MRFHSLLSGLLSWDDSTLMLCISLELFPEIKEFLPPMHAGPLCHHHGNSRPVKDVFGNIYVNQPMSL